MIPNKCINVKTGQEICSVFFLNSVMFSWKIYVIGHSKKFYRIQIKTKAWNIGGYMLEWTYNVSKVTAYVTKKTPPCHRWGFLLPSKRVNHYFLRFLSHNLKSSDNTLISNGARNTVSKVSNICNTSLP